MTITSTMAAGWRRLAFALALPMALLMAERAEAASCSGTDSLGNVFSFTNVPDTLDFGQTLGFTLQVTGPLTTGAGSGLDFVDGPNYGAWPDSGPAATTSVASIIRYAPTAAAGSRVLSGYPVAGTHYFRTSASTASDQPCVTVVSKNTTSTALTASPSVTNYGDSVRLAATVAAPTLPTGTVSFTDEGAALGSGTLAPRPVPGTVSLGADHACVVDSGGGLDCWGGNGSGQLGTGDTTGRTLAGAAVPFSSGVTGVAAGLGFTCAVKTDGTVACWGVGGNGQLGNGGTSTRTTPVTVLNVAQARSVATGDAHACAVTADGALWCWGAGSNARIGDGGADDRSTPVRVITSGVQAVAAGKTATCALRNDGSVACWGSMLVNGGTQSFGSTPTTVSQLGTSVRAISGDGDNMCAVMTDTTMRCWGDNSYGQLGDGSLANRNLVPVQPQNLANVASLATGDGTTCAVRSNGDVFCWGRRDRGRVGDNTTDGTTPSIAYTATPQQVALPAESGSIFQLNGLASASSPDFATLPVGIAFGGGRALLVSDLGAVKGWGAAVDGSATVAALPTALLGARSVRMEATTAIATTTIGAGSARSLVASYGGDSNRAGSVSPAATQTVAKVATALSNFVLSTTGPVAYGDPVTLSVNVSPVMSQGQVEFYVGSTVVATANVSNGVATGVSTTIPVGTSVVIGARYVESANYLGSVSSTTQTIRVTRPQSTVTITTDKTQSDYGSPVVVTVSVVPASAVGTVRLTDTNNRDSVTNNYSGSFSGGKAIFTLSDLSPASTHTLQATYDGNDDVLGDTSGTVTVAINKMDVKITTGQTPAAPVYGDRVTILATVEADTVTALANPAKPASTVTVLVNGVSRTVSLGTDLTGCRSTTSTPAAMPHRSPTTATARRIRKRPAAASRSPRSARPFDLGERDLRQSESGRDLHARGDADPGTARRQHCADGQRSRRIRRRAHQRFGHLHADLHGGREPDLPVGLFRIEQLRSRFDHADGADRQGRRLRDADCRERALRAGELLFRDGGRVAAVNGHAYRHRSFRHDVLDGRPDGSRHGDPQFRHGDADGGPFGGGHLHRDGGISRKRPVQRADERRGERDDFRGIRHGQGDADVGIDHRRRRRDPGGDGRTGEPGRRTSAGQDHLPGRRGDARRGDAELSGQRADDGQSREREFLVAARDRDAPDHRRVHAVGRELRRELVGRKSGHGVEEPDEHDADCR